MAASSQKAVFEGNGMSQFYKLNPSDWNVGTDNLTLEHEAAYLRIINAIHLYDQPIKNNLRVLSGLWRCNERKAKRLLSELLETQKITIEDENIVNERAMNDVLNRRQLSVERASTGRRGGIESGKSRAKSLRTNGRVQASGSTRIEESKKKNIEKEKGNLASRIPEDFPSEAEFQWATKERHIPPPVVREEMATFHDHYKAAVDSKGRFLAWPLVWKNWIRRDLNGNIKKATEFYTQMNGGEPAKSNQSQKDNAAFSQALGMLRRNEGGIL